MTVEGLKNVAFMGRAHYEWPCPCCRQRCSSTVAPGDAGEAACHGCRTKAVRVVMALHTRSLPSTACPLCSSGDLSMWVHDETCPKRMAEEMFT